MRQNHPSSKKHHHHVSTGLRRHHHRSSGQSVVQLSGGLHGASVDETQGGEPSTIGISRHQGSSGQSVVQFSGGLPGASVGETQGGEPSAIDISRHQGSSGQSLVQLSGGLPGASVGETQGGESSGAVAVHVNPVTFERNEFILYRPCDLWLSRFRQMKAKSCDCCSYHGCCNLSNKNPCRRCTINSGSLAIVSRFCGLHKDHKLMGHMTELESFGLWVDILNKSENLRVFFGVSASKDILKLSEGLHLANIAPSSFVFTRLEDMQQLCDDITCFIL
jgi:hypothetical protein